MLETVLSHLIPLYAGCEINNLLLKGRLSFFVQVRTKIRIIHLDFAVVIPSGCRS